MVRAAGASQRNDSAASPQEKAQDIEHNRLRDLAFSRGILSKTKSHALHPLRPSNLLLKSDGKDIVKKTNRKSKYLFSFPGLMAPIAGGKLGALSNLDSKNPVLYVDFPEGRLKLLGTIVYPKNKYLILHVQRGAGSILCEDVFESLVVFSVAQWIGTKEQNPEEISLPLPKCLNQVKHSEFDFTAGAGQGKESNTTKQQNEKVNQLSPVHQHVQTAGEIPVQAITYCFNQASDIVMEETIAERSILPKCVFTRVELGDDSGSNSDSISDRAVKVMTKQQQEISRERTCSNGAKRKRSRQSLQDESGKSCPVSLDSGKKASKGKKLAKHEETPGANAGCHMEQLTCVGRTSGRITAKRRKMADLSGELSDATDVPSDDSDEDWNG